MITYLKIVAGHLLLAVGLVGLVLPIIPGIPLLVAGAALLGPKNPIVRPFFARLRWWRRRKKLRQR